MLAVINRGLLERSARSLGEALPKERPILESGHEALVAWDGMVLSLD